MTFCPAKKPKTTLTPHQYEVLKIVIVGNDSKDPTLILADLDEILERVTRKTSKQSIQFTIRALIHNGMMTKAGRLARRGRQRVTYEATDQGIAVADDRPKVAAFLEPVSDEAIDTFLSSEVA